MSKIIDLNKYKQLKSGPISLEADDINSILSLFFQCNFTIFAVTGKDENDLIGYAANIGENDETPDVTKHAISVWDMSFKSKAFETVDSIICTLMDCMLEQYDIDGSFSIGE